MKEKKQELKKQEIKKRAEKLAKKNWQFDDVGMSEELQVLDLSTDLPDDVETLDLLPVHDLDRDLVSGQHVHPRYKVTQIHSLHIY